MANRGGEMHQVMAVGFPEREVATEPPVPPLEDRTLKQAPAECPMDMLQRPLAGCPLLTQHVLDGSATSPLKVAADDTQQILRAFDKARRHEVGFPNGSVTILR